jgi:phytoene/squalene synthetase
MTNTAALARSITKSSSQQTYLTARLLADRDLADDCMRAYAYFRWADDMIDISIQSSSDRTTFINRQKKLIDYLYQGERPIDITPEEEMLADLVAHDRGSDSGLRSFIQNFMAVIEFDALRRGRQVSRKEMDAYTTRLATAVMDGLQYFIGNGHPYPKTMDRNQAVVGAHIAHMLRDTLEDVPAGYINISSEEIHERNIRIEDPDSEVFRAWVREQVSRAEGCFQAGKGYIDRLDNLRCKLAGAWYCARFEWYLNKIKRDGYCLRESYPGRRALTTWVKMIALGLAITVKYFFGKLQRNAPHPESRVALGPERNIPA